MGWRSTCRLLPALLAMGLLLSGCVVAAVAGAAAGGTLALTHSEDPDSGADGAIAGSAPATGTDATSYQDSTSDALPVEGTAPVAAVQVQPLD